MEETAYLYFIKLRIFVDEKFYFWDDHERIWKFLNWRKNLISETKFRNKEKTKININIIKYKTYYKYININISRNIIDRYKYIKKYQKEDSIWKKENGTKRCNSANDKF